MASYVEGRGEGWPEAAASLAAAMEQIDEDCEEHGQLAKQLQPPRNVAAWRATDQWAAAHEPPVESVHARPSFRVFFAGAESDDKRLEAAYPGSSQPSAALPALDELRAVPDALACPVWWSVVSAGTFPETVVRYRRPRHLAHLPPHKFFRLWSLRVLRLDTLAARNVTHSPVAPSRGN